MPFIRLFILLALITSPALVFAQDDSDAGEVVEDVESSDVDAPTKVPRDDADAVEDDDAAASVEVSRDEPGAQLPSSGLMPGSGLLMEENQGRARTNRIGAFVIGGWAIGNFTWATIGLLGEPDDRERAFHLTNAAVNLVVAGVAVGTYFSNVPDESWDEFGVVDTLNEAHGTEKLYLLATGLDVAYFMTGAFLTAKGNVQPVNEGMIGTGRSLMLQGAFLFAFDATMFTFHMLRRSKFVRELIGAK